MEITFESDGSMTVIKRKRNNAGRVICRVKPFSRLHAEAGGEVIRKE